MRWSYGGCLQLSPSKLDLLQDILKSVHEGLLTGFLQMGRSEIEDFNELCSQADLHLRPIDINTLPQLKRVI